LFMIISLYILSTFFFLHLRPPPSSTLFPYTTLFRSQRRGEHRQGRSEPHPDVRRRRGDHLLHHAGTRRAAALPPRLRFLRGVLRSEEHTSELQSRGHLVCRLLLEKKKKE